MRLIKAMYNVPCQNIYNVYSMHGSNTWRGIAAVCLGVQQTRVLGPLSVQRCTGAGLCPTYIVLLHAAHNHAVVPADMNTNAMHEWSSLVVSLLSLCGCDVVTWSSLALGQSQVRHDQEAAMLMPATSGGSCQSASHHPHLPADTFHTPAASVPVAHTPAQRK